MAGLTNKFLFRKPAGTDAVNVDLDINESMDKIDKLYGGKAMVKYTTGNIEIPHPAQSAGAYWTQLPVGGQAGMNDLDLRVKAIAGDYIEVGVNGLWDAQTPEGYMDCMVKNTATTFSGLATPFPSPGSVGQGIVGWRGESTRHIPISGSVFKQLVSGDLDGSGYVNIIFLARSSSTTVRKKIWANAGLPFQVFLINHGSNI